MLWRHRDFPISVGVKLFKLFSVSLIVYLFLVVISFAACRIYTSMKCLEIEYLHSMQDSLLRKDKINVNLIVLKLKRLNKAEQFDLFIPDKVDDIKLLKNL